MVFKQGPLKAQSISLIVTAIIYAAIIGTFLYFGYTSYQFDVPTLLLLGFLFLIVILPVFLVELKNMEWYHIYKDRIEARTVFGLKNTVYFKNVSSVEEVDIKVDMFNKKTYYIFDDGRKNSNNIFGLYQFYNNKKINLRIYKTKKLESYIKKNLRFKIV